MIDNSLRNYGKGETGKVGESRSKRPIFFVILSRTSAAGVDYLANNDT